MFAASRSNKHWLFEGEWIFEGMFLGVCSVSDTPDLTRPTPVAFSFKFNWSLSKGVRTDYLFWFVLKLAGLLYLVELNFWAVITVLGVFWAVNLVSVWTLLPRKFSSGDWDGEEILWGIWIGDIWEESTSLIILSGLPFFKNRVSLRISWFWSSISCLWVWCSFLMSMCLEILGVSTLELGLSP